MITIFPPTSNSLLFQKIIKNKNLFHSFFYLKIKRKRRARQVDSRENLDENRNEPELAMDGLYTHLIPGGGNHCLGNWGCGRGGNLNCLASGLGSRDEISFDPLTKSTKKWSVRQSLVQIIQSPLGRLGGSSSQLRSWRRRTWRTRRGRTILQGWSVGWIGQTISLGSHISGNTRRNWGNWRRKPWTQATGSGQSSSHSTCVFRHACHVTGGGDLIKGVCGGSSIILSSVVVGGCVINRFLINFFVFRWGKGGVRSVECTVSTSKRPLRSRRGGGAGL